MEKKKGTDVVNLAAELYAILENSERSQQFEKYLSKLLCQEPWLCWKAISQFLQFIREDTVGGTKKRNAMFRQIVYQFINDRGENTLNLTHPEIKDKLEKISMELARGNDNAFDIRPIFELQAQAEILIAFNLKTFLKENPLSDEAANKNSNSANLLVHNSEVRVWTLVELQMSRKSKPPPPKLYTCTLNGPSKTLLLANPETKEDILLDLKHVHYTFSTQKKRTLELQYFTHTSQKIYHITLPLNLVSVYSETLDKIRRVYVHFPSFFKLCPF